MKYYFIFVIYFLPGILSQCPESADISPCECMEFDSKSRLSCFGNIWLPRLTSILRTEMCGNYVDKFELMESNITYLPSNLFLKMHVGEINIYAVNVGRFTQAGESAFFGLENALHSLSMRRCSLVDELAWQMIGLMQFLTYLDLSYNNLTRLPPQWFRHPPPSLRSLILKGNKICALEPGAMTFMHSLVELDLSENRITKLNRDAFPRPGNSLIFLRLSYNQLEAIPEDLFDEMLGIQRIYLDNNLITTLPEATWRHVWGDLDTLDLYGNKIICDSSMRWMMKLRSPRRLYGSCIFGELKSQHSKLDDADEYFIQEEDPQK